MSNLTDYALLIDGDNVNTSYLAPLEEYVEHKLNGRIHTTHLFGCLKSSYLDDWKRVFKKNDTVVKYDISPSVKNSADVRMLCVALQLYYDKGIRNFIIMSSDCDMESLVEGLSKDASIIVAYSALRVSPKYIERLCKRKVSCLNLDDLRGPLKPSEVSSILQNMMESYIQYKLGENFFNYQTVLDWIGMRYPELKGVLTLQDRDPSSCFKDVKVTFTQEGAIIQPLEEV